MILLDFRYQDPWAEENFTLPDFVQQSQAQQRQDQQITQQIPGSGSAVSRSSAGAKSRLSVSGSIAGKSLVKTYCFL